MSSVATAAEEIVERESGLGQWARAARLETTLVLGCLVVIALHVLDDNYLQPQPGTSAADHLASGLVPVAILALVAALYPRLPAGLVVDALTMALWRCTPDPEGLFTTLTAAARADSSGRRNTF